MRLNLLPYSWTISSWCANSSFHVELYNRLLHRTKCTVSVNLLIFGLGPAWQQAKCSLTGYWFHNLYPLQTIISLSEKLRIDFWVCKSFVFAAPCWCGAQDCWELPRPLHRREGLRLQGLHLPPHHPRLHVPGEAAVKQSLAIFHLLGFKEAEGVYWCGDARLCYLSHL